MRRLFDPGDMGSPASEGRLALRLAVGAAFLFHGWPNGQHPTGWMGPDAPVPGIMQTLAAAEFGGGLALIPGLLTRQAALGMTGVMAVAMATVHVPHGDPFVGGPGQPSADPAAVYLASAILFLVAGAGRFSLDAHLFDRERPAIDLPARPGSESGL